MGYAHAQGFRWGMTSNATLITPEVARRLAEVGMGTISVSIDGLRETHDRLRGLAGGYDRAMAGIQNLLDVGTFHAVQVTTVVNHGNIDQLDELFAIMDGIDIDSWRVINLEPIGRALTHPDLMLTHDDYVRLFEFIREKRRAGYPLEYGCSHYLGLEYEAEVREWYWLCNAGVYTAAVMANGDIGACLDIERRPETIQGNIRTRAPARRVGEPLRALPARPLGLVRRMPQLRACALLPRRRPPQLGLRPQLPHGLPQGHAVLTPSRRRYALRGHQLHSFIAVMRST